MTAEMRIILVVIAKGNVHYYALNDPAEEYTKLPVISIFLAVQNSAIKQHCKNN